LISAEQENRRGIMIGGTANECLTFFIKKWGNDRVNSDIIILVLWRSTLWTKIYISTFKKSKSTKVTTSFWKITFIF
jgi:hypothetical protein